nr:uncharacterized protein LOC111986459 [Quercus suber]
MNDSISLSELHLEELWEMRESLSMKILLELLFTIMSLTKLTNLVPSSQIKYNCKGFLPVEALISEIEVWGLGGKAAKEVQSSYKKREEFFTEQRRKVDLKTFGSWDESPEKMMMDMISDPNAVQREDH